MGCFASELLSLSPMTVLSLVNSEMIFRRERSWFAVRKVWNKDSVEIRDVDNRLEFVVAGETELSLLEQEVENYQQLKLACAMWKDGSGAIPSRLVDPTATP